MRMTPFGRAEPSLFLRSWFERCRAPRHDSGARCLPDDFRRRGCTIPSARVAHCQPDRRFLRRDGRCERRIRTTFSSFGCGSAVGTAIVACHCHSLPPHEIYLRISSVEGIRELPQASRERERVVTHRLGVRWRRRHQAHKVIPRHDCHRALAILLEDHQRCACMAICPRLGNRAPHVYPLLILGLDAVGKELLCGRRQKDILSSSTHARGSNIVVCERWEGVQDVRGHLLLQAAPFRFGRLWSHS